MEQLILICHVIVCTCLIGLILIQHGKGAEVGASFGSGASQTIFGSQGSASFISRATAILIAVFFATSLALGYVASSNAKPKDIDELIKQVQPLNVQSSVKDDDVPKTPSQPQKEEGSDIPNFPVLEGIKDKK